MAGLSAARNTPRRTGEFGVIGVEANTSIYLGSLVMIDGSGYAVPGQVLGAGALASLRMFGVAKAVLYNSYPGQNAINTSASIKPGGATPAGNAGDFQLECYRKGVFGFDFDSSITAAAPQI